jgi:acyl-coenzyme A thioesterase PaaI-like protein
MSKTLPSTGELMAATVPMVRTLDLEFGETTAERAVVRMPDQPDFHNHVGGPHAGAMFTLAESASGAIVARPRTSSPSWTRGSAPSSPSASRSHARTVPSPAR